MLMASQSKAYQLPEGIIDASTSLCRDSSWILAQSTVYQMVVAAARPYSDRVCRAISSKAVAGTELVRPWLQHGRGFVVLRGGDKANAAKWGSTPRITRHRGERERRKEVRQ